MGVMVAIAIVVKQMNAPEAIPQPRGQKASESANICKQQKNIQIHHWTSAVQASDIEGTCDCFVMKEPIGLGETLAVLQAGQLKTQLTCAAQLEHVWR
jgi:hypothetical protein